MFCKPLEAHVVLIRHTGESGETSFQCHYRNAILFTKRFSLCLGELLDQPGVPNDQTVQSPAPSQVVDHIGPAYPYSSPNEGDQIDIAFAGGIYDAQPGL
jgi:hypothetical protein